MVVNSPWYRQQRYRLGHHWVHHLFLLQEFPSPEWTLSSRSLRQLGGKSVSCQLPMGLAGKYVEYRTFSSCVRFANFFFARNLLFLGTITSWNGLPIGVKSASGVVLLSMLLDGEALGSVSRSKGLPPMAIEESEVILADLGVRE